MYLILGLLVTAETLFFLPWKSKKEKVLDRGQNVFQREDVLTFFPLTGGCSEGLGAF